MSNTKRIAKNTFILYFRQIITILVSLYTVRVVLNTLGAEDYGIYNVVAGVVILFSFINSAMTSGTQRFLNFYLGKKDEKKTNEVYSSSILIHFSIALIFIILAETVGLWFVNFKLNIPVERITASRLVYQFAIFTTFFSILKVPYHSVMIAYEKMNFFAIISVIESILKLGVAFFLSISLFDKLVFYAFLLFIVSILITLCYKIYCNKAFKIAHYKKVRDLKFIKEQLIFSGWSTLGAVANVANFQGANIVLNMFTNVTVNAAMGIANQVNNAVYSFVTNFQTAFRPQIVKNYAEENKNYFIHLVILTSKISFFLLLYIVVPFIVNMDFILTLWLKNIPNYSVQFVTIILLISLVEAWNGPLWMSIQATGQIKKYQLIVSLFIFSNLPLSVLLLALTRSPEIVLVIRLFLNIIITIWRIGFIGKRISLPKKEYYINVLLRCLIVFICSYFLTMLVGSIIKNSVIYFFMTCILSIVFTSLLIFFLGATKDERTSVLKFIDNKVMVNNGK